MQKIKLNKNKLQQYSLIIAQLLEPIFYYDIFSYPLKLEEIHNYGNFTKKVTIVDLEKTCDLLVKNNYLYKIGNYYLLENCPSWIVKREENNKRAEIFKRRAKWVTKFMTFFPYVRAVFISGSLSKNVMPKDGDIDYFVVTKPNRLWLTRTLLVLFKKVFLFNSHKYFCVNYFVDENLLEIEEKNRFTATEIATILPLYGKEIYSKFWDENQWITNYYPAINARNVDAIPSQKRTFLQVIAEFTLNRKFGDWLENYCMKKTIHHWNKKFGNLDQKDFDVALKSRTNVSKHHPQQFQKKVLQAFDERVQQFEKKYELNLKIISSKSIQE